jgi:exodeoxyribonuclease X
MVRLIVCDTETSGLSETDQVVELATVEVWKNQETWIQGLQWVTLVKPACSITPAAQGIHHVSYEMLADAPTMAELLGGPTAVPLFDREAVLVAHNLDFDVRMLLQSGVPDLFLPEKRLCTCRCSMHLYPEELSHKNQSLRYALHLTVPATDYPPHRALPDAVVTAALLIKMLETNSVEELIELTTTPVLLRKVPFGKSRGRMWEDMDVGFCKWVIGKDFSEDVLHTAKYWLEKKEEA